MKILIESSRGDGYILLNSNDCENVGGKWSGRGGCIPPSKGKGKGKDNKP